MSETFTDAQKRVFSFEVAGQRLWADPLTVRRRLDHYLGRSLNQVLAEAQNSDPVVKFQADEELLKAARLAFELPWDPLTGGATEVEIRTALRGLADFLSGSVTPVPMMQPSWPGLDPSLVSPPAMNPTSAFSST